jgi:hypothetical protein
MMRRTLFDELGGFDETLPQGQDYEFWLRASRLTPVAKLCVALEVYCIRAGSVTTIPKSVNYGALVLERAIATWGGTGPNGRTTPDWKIRRLLAERWSNFAYRHAFLGGDPHISVPAFLRALSLEPLRTRTWINLARAVLASGRRSLAD